MVDLRIRDARPEDGPAVVALIQEMAGGAGDSSPITTAYATTYLFHPGSGVLLAEEEGRVVGLLSYSVRPDLYHAGPAALVEELVVHAPLRGRGIGGALLRAFLARMIALGCMEVAVAVMPDNRDAQRLYRANGLVEEALLLERHLEFAARPKTLAFSDPAGYNGRGSFLGSTRFPNRRRCRCRRRACPQQARPSYRRSCSCRCRGQSRSAVPGCGSS